MSQIAARAETRPAPSPAAPVTSGLTDRARAERKLAYLLCAPAVLVMLLVTGFPILYAIWLSLQRSDLRFPNASKFVWFDNYRTVLESSTWWKDVEATAILTVLSVTIEGILGMLIALAMYRAIFARTAIRASVLVPYGAVTVVAAFGWRYAFDPATGFVNQLFGVGTPLLTTRWGSIFVIVLAEVWKTTPFIALILLGGLSLVPEELYKAARVDGAGTMQQFFRITLPLIKPAIMVALLFRTLDAFRIFDSVFIMTRGANDTETVSILGANVLITRLNLGLGSAISVLIFIIVIGIAFLFTKVLGTGTERR